MANNTNKIEFQLDFKTGDIKAFNDIKKQLNELKTLSSSGNFGLDAKELQEVLNAANQVERALDKAFDPKLNTVNIQKFNQILNQSGLNINTLRKNLSNAGADGQAAFLKLTSQLMQFNTVTRQTNQFLDSIATSLFNTIKWSAMSSIINNITGTIQKSYYYVKDLDSSLNDIRIVTNKSADEMGRFAEEANEAAKALAVTTEDYTKGSLIYYQQGLDDETVKTLTDITAKTSNVTQQSMSTVSEQLTAVQNGYQVANQAAEEGMQVYEEYVDKMAAVGASTASDLQELSTAMSKVASAASSMGVGFDDLNAQIATIVSVTRQAPESVGTALKTIYARLGDLKVDGVDEFGTKLGEVTSQLQTMGINILDTNGDMRAMTDVMAEVAQKQDTQTSAQRQAAAVAMAGKRQYNNLIALFDNWDKYSQALEVSANAAGTLEKQQETALESLANKMDVLKATAEDLYDSLFNTDTISDFVESGTKVLQLLADFSDSIGGLNNLLPMLGSLGLTVFSDQIGRALSTIVINARNFKSEQEMMLQNQQALQAMFYQSSFVTNGENSNNEAIKNSYQELVSYYNEMSRYQSIMTKEQKEEYSNILKIKNEAGELSVQLEQQMKFYEGQNKNISFVDTNILKNLDDLRAVSEETEKLNAIIDTIQDNIESNNFTSDKADAVLENIKNKYASTKAEQKQFEKDFVRIFDTEFRLNGKKAEKALEAVRDRMISARNTLNEMTNTKVKIDSLNNSFKSLGDASKEAIKTQFDISNISKAIGAVGQLASALNTLKNMGSIQENDDTELGDKVLQTVMNLSFVLPGLIGSFSSLTKLMSTYTTLGKSINAVNTLINSSKMTETSIMDLLTKTQTKENLTREISIKLGREYAKTHNMSVAAISLEDRARIKSQASKEADIILTQKQTLAVNMHRLALLGVVAASALVVIAIASIIKKQNEAEEAARQRRIEEQKQYEEQRNNSRKEIEENQELLKSYNELYDKYKQGIVSKEELSKKTEELTGVLTEEQIAVANLTGDYESLNKKILENRKLETQKKIEEDKKAVKENTDKIKENEILTNMSYSTTDDFWERYNLLTEEQQKLIKFDDEEKRTYHYDFSELENVTDAIAALRTNKNLDSEEYELIVNYVANADAATKDMEIDQIESDYYDKTINSYEEYNNNLSNLIKELENTSSFKGASYGDLFKEAVRILDATQIGVEDYKNRAVATNSFVNKYGTENEQLIREKLAGLSDEDLSLALQLDLDQDTFKNHLEDFINKAKGIAEYNTIPLKIEAVDNLTDQIVSGKELDDKVKQAFQEAFVYVNQDQDAFQSNLDEGTPLEKLNKINDFIESQNKKIYEDTKHTKKLNEEALSIIPEFEEKLQRLQKRKEELEKQPFNNPKTIQELYEVSEEIQAINNQLDEQKQYEDIDIDFNDTALQVMTNVVDEIISGAELAKNAAELIGEGFLVAAEDAEELFKVYPALQNQAEVLANGDIQLNKEVVQAIMNGNLDIMKSNTEVADQQLQQQIDMLQAQIDYNKSKMDILDQYLKGEISQQEAEDKINKAGAKFEEDLINAVGETEVDNAKIALNANNELTSATLLNLDKIGQQAVLLGQTIADALAGKAASYTSSGGGNAGGSVSDYSGYTDSAVDRVKAAGLEAALQAEAEMARLKEETKGLEKQLANAQLLQSKIRAGATAAEQAMSGAASGAGGKIKDDKSGGKDKDKDEKKQEDEFDRYQEIKKAIDAVDKALSRLDKTQENLYGYELINSLRQENELIAQQAANYERLYEMQQQEAAELRAQLGTMGVMFDASGAIMNYAAATSQALQAYAAAIEQYNAGLIDETTLKVFEKSYENFKKLLERYDTLFYTEMEDTQDKLEDARRKQLANNLKAWETEIQIRLDTTKAERDWNEFLKDIQQNFRKVYSDLTIDVNFDEDNFQSIVDDVGTTLRAIKDVEGEINKLMSGGTSDMFESVSQAQEKLKELQEQLLEQGKSLYDLYKQVWDAYLDGMDQVADKFEDIMNQYEHFNNLLDYHRELIELIYGDKNYDLMDTYYKTQAKNIEAQINSLRQQVDFWQNEFNKSFEFNKDQGVDINDMTTWTEDMKKAYEQMIEAQENLNDLVLEGVKILQEQYLNSINKINDAMDKGIWGSGGFDEIKSDQEFMQKKADEFLDDVQGAAKIQTLANKIDQSIASTSNLKAQQKLQKLREDEITMLREKENLTQADLDIAEARYQIALKEIALEDAQNNKTSMKLTRNEQGNWSYQYVADEEDIQGKQQDLLQSYLDLYDLANDSYEHSMNLVMDLYEEMQEKMRTIAEDTTLKEEVKLQKIQEIQDKYLPLIEAAAENSEIYKREAMMASAMVFKEVCEEDETAYDALTETQKSLVNSLKDTSISDYEEMRDAIIGDFYPGLRSIAEEVFKSLNINSQTTAAEIIKQQATDPAGVKNMINKAVDEMQKAIQKYEEELNKLQEIADTDFGNIEQDIEDVSERIDEMEGTTEKMVDNSSQYLDELRRVLDAVAKSWDDVIGQILEAQRAMQEYISLMAAARQAASVGPGSGGSGAGGIGGANGNGSGGNNSGGNTGTVKYAVLISSDDGRDNISLQYDNIEAARKIFDTYKGQKGYGGSLMKLITNAAGETTRQTIDAFLTGGYTGTQNDNGGRLAMLHQKELVLNEDDTRNFLSGISMLRDMTKINGSVEASLAKSMARMVIELNNNKAYNIGGGVDSSPVYGGDTFYVTAEFPNATEINDIREALINLPTYASQFVGRTIR